MNGGREVHHGMPTRCQLGHAPWKNIASRQRGCPALPGARPLTLSSRVSKSKSPNFFVRPGFGSGSASAHAHSTRRSSEMQLEYRRRVFTRSDFRTGCRSSRLYGGRHLWRPPSHIHGPMCTFLSRRKLSAASAPTRYNWPSILFSWSRNPLPSLSRAARASPIFDAARIVTTFLSFTT